MTATATTISRAAIYEAVRRAYRVALERGGNRWYYVRVWPDGDITVGSEADPHTRPESEYFGRRPCSATVWSLVVVNSVDDADIESEMDALDRDWLDANVGDLVEQLELTGLTLTA